MGIRGSRLLGPVLSQERQITGGEADPVARHVTVAPNRVRQMPRGALLGRVRLSQVSAMRTWSTVPTLASPRRASIDQGQQHPLALRPAR